MIGRQLLGSKWTRTLSAVPSVVAGASALAKGRTKQGALLVAGGVFSLRWSSAGFAVQLAAEAVNRR
ncbi:MULTISPECIES: hypothetical protein [unclassified Haloferax]|uniref:hypothetical protein n=1 Tax=unclassified Haloferax TaxID=2625095 RepID=UPI0011C07E60|nr:MULTISPECIES: hypothetical protein [unclassified Haloferax]